MEAEVSGFCGVSGCCGDRGRRESHYRRDVDGLRGVACAAVVCYHVAPEMLPSGFAGVDIFFVISGYVVTLSMLSGAPMSPAAFYARRVRRLAPLTIVVVLSTALAISCIVPLVGSGNGAGGNTDQSQYLRGYYHTGLFSLCGGANMQLAFASQDRNGYWGQGKGSSEWNPFTHFWSLGIEEQ